MAAYVKDLKAGKLDARAQIGFFLGHDSESKGYRIYWPGKLSVTVERNVVFNKNNVKTLKNFTIISGNSLAEGERDKIIQDPKNNAENSENPDNQPVSDPQPEPKQTNPPTQSLFHPHLRKQQILIQDQKTRANLNHMDAVNTQESPKELIKC